jgi:hypothetical protein
MGTVTDAFDRLTQIDSTKLGRSISALAKVEKPLPEPMARVSLSVPLRELKYTEQGDDFPLVSWYGYSLEVCDSDYEIVSDHYHEWLREQEASWN